MSHDRSENVNRGFRSAPANHRVGFSFLLSLSFSFEMCHAVEPSDSLQGLLRKEAAEVRVWRRGAAAEVPI